MRYPGDKPTFISLFSGGGGLDLGFLHQGYECLGAYDRDSAAVQNYNANLGPHSHVWDLENGLPASTMAIQPDVLLAGAPCQGFSTIGKRHVDDPRNRLLKTTAVIALELQPKVIVVENVPGALAGDHRAHWNTLEDTLKAAGYNVRTDKYSAGDFGLAQLRKRIVLLAWNTGRMAVCAPTPTAPTRLRDVLNKLSGTKNHEKEYLKDGSQMAAIASRIKPGQKLSNVRVSANAVHTWEIPEVYGVVTDTQVEVLKAIQKLRRRNRVRKHGDADPVSGQTISSYLGRAIQDDLLQLTERGFVRQIHGNYDLKNTFNGKFRRLSWAEPSPAVDTKFGEARHFLHPDENRGFTPREAARIQGFPDTYVMSGPPKEQYRIIGNAVPPPMAAAFARFIRDQLL